MGNNGSSKIIAIGDILAKTCIGEIITLRDVRYIPDFRMNLISSEKLDDQGYTNIFGKGQWKLVKDSQIIAKGMRVGALYRSKLEVINNHINIVESSMELWHNRLGHMSEKGLNTLSKREIIPKFDGSNLKTCSHCLMGKQHRGSFNKQAKRKGKVLELVYSDVCGPMTTKTLGGCCYFATFVDDH
ncbi:hypothetical protein LIER_20998 [Lithospermum erythrorhizon]